MKPGKPYMTLKQFDTLLQGVALEVLGTYETNFNREEAERMDRNARELGHSAPWLTGSVLCPDGSGVLISTRNHDGKLEISGLFPRDALGQWAAPSRNDSPTIRISLDRAMNMKAKDIWREIHRRLYPGYLPVLEQTRKNIADVADGLAKRDEARAKLAECGAEPYGVSSGMTDKRDPVTYDIRGAYDMPIEIDKISITYYGRVKFTVEASATLATDIIKRTMDYNNKHRKEE